MSKPISLSIITVNYNSGLNLKKTLTRLVPYANHDGVELILIDGNSTDCSLHDAKEFKEFIAEFISEKDNGIFDAMNKGIKYSRGKWLWFINSGDFPIITVVQMEDLLNSAVQEKANLIYSDLLVDGNYIEQEFNIKTLIFSMINHQNIIYNRELIKDGYDDSFKYCADYYHLLNNFNSVSPYKSNVALCNYDGGGVSSTLSRKIRIKLWIERLNAQRKSNIKFALKLLFILCGLTVIVIKVINPRIGSKKIITK